MNKIRKSKIEFDEMFLLDSDSYYIHYNVDVMESSLIMTSMIMFSKSIKDLFIEDLLESAEIYYILDVVIEEDLATWTSLSNFYPHLTQAMYFYICELLEHTHMNILGPKELFEASANVQKFLKAFIDRYSRVIDFNSLLND